MNTSSSTPRRAILLASSFAFIVVQLDVTIVNVALPEVGRELEAGVGALQWVVDAYTLGFAVFLLTAGLMGGAGGRCGIRGGGKARARPNASHAPVWQCRLLCRGGVRHGG